MISLPKDFPMASELPSGGLAVYVFLEMVALAFVFGAVEAFTNNKPWYVWAGCLVLGVLFFLAGIRWGTPTGFAILGILVCAVLAYGGYRYHHNTTTDNQPVALQPTELYMECRIASLPIHIPPNEVAHVKAFNKKQYGNTKSAIDDIRNEGTKELLWPDQRIMKKVKFPTTPFDYECEVTNHAAANLMDIVIALSVNFDNEKPPLIYNVIISPLDAGKTFSFHLVNECPIQVSVISPNTATVQVFGEEQRRTIPLHWPHRSPIEQIMMFFPSNVSWTGNACQ